MQPQSPNPDFDFMLKNNQQPSRGQWLSHLHGRTKVTLGVIGAIIILIVVFALLAGRNSGGTQPIINVLARAQETVRVTNLTQQQLHLQDPQTQALAATVFSSLSSDRQQLIKYLATNHTKVSSSLLAADIDKSTDSSLQSASQNNNLDAAYIVYLKDSLAKYENDLQIAYKSAGPNGKKILSDAFDSTKALLNSPPLKS